jgi:hypothetical protein
MKELNSSRPGPYRMAWLFALPAIAALLPVILVVTHASKYGLLYVPIASWIVLGLSALALLLDGVAFYLWRRLRRERRALADVKKRPLYDEIPVVYGHRGLERAEFLTLIQVLFRHPPDVQYVHARALPGGYGGSMTVLAELQRKQGEPRLPRSFVVKLGPGAEMDDEHTKFHNHVLATLPRAPRFFRYAQWGDWAGIAYEFAGLEPDEEIQSFHQFYKGYATVEVVALIGEIYAHLGRAWHQDGEHVRINLYHEYNLLHKKQESIVAQIARSVDRDDPYRTELGSGADLKPNFCPGIPWYDPATFLRRWPQRDLSLSIYRSTVHGDLHARNVLVEIERDGPKRVWFIDFSHTGNGLSGARTQEALREGLSIHPQRGHTLRDFCHLEADVKFILTPLQDEGDLTLALAFERELMACGLALYDLTTTAPPIEALREERFRKAWQVVREIRLRAAAYLVHADDLRPYTLGLLQATLPITYYHPGQFENETCERQQKRYALLSAGMLCRQLDPQSSR